MLRRISKRSATSCLYYLLKKINKQINFKDKITMSYIKKYIHQDLRLFNRFYYIYMFEILTLFPQYMFLLFSYFINATLLEILVQKIELNVYLAQIIATLISAIFTYVSFKTFAFRRNK